MGSRHINEIEFKEYGQGGLGPSDFLRVHAHLENCDKCKRRIDDMFPSVVIDDLTTLLGSSTTDKSPEFHLNYDDHFKPYVDESIGPVDQELIESHVETCMRCRDDLRDIISFHQELKQERELKHLTQDSTVSNLKAWFLASTRRMAWVAMAGLVIFVGAGSIWYYVKTFRDGDQAVQNAEAADPVSVGKDPNIEPPVEVTRTEPSATTDAGEKGANGVLKGDESETASLFLPGFLRELRVESRGSLRSDGDDAPQRLTLVSPNGVAIRNSSPILKWRPTAGIERYEVAVFDENDNRIGGAESVKGDSWPTATLAKGKLYKWQVTGKSVSEDGKTHSVVGQGKFYVVSQLDENRISQARDSLARGKALAEAGLLNDAAVEFRRHLNLNPGSTTAKGFLQQVEQAKR